MFHDISDARRLIAVADVDSSRHMLAGYHYDYGFCHADFSAPPIRLLMSLIRCMFRDIYFISLFRHFACRPPDIMPLADYATLARCYVALPLRY